MTKNVLPLVNDPRLLFKIAQRGQISSQILLIPRGVPIGSAISLLKYPGNAREDTRPAKSLQNLRIYRPGALTGRVFQQAAKPWATINPSSKAKRRSQNQAAALHAWFRDEPSVGCKRKC
jgi:hypothetical protein